MKKIIVLFIISLFAICAFAASGKAPQYRSLHVRGMGNAFIGVADSKDAIYYNPAGLNLINRLGNFKKNPDMGYVPHNGWTLNLFNVAVELPGDEMNDIMDACGTKGFWSAIRGMLVFDFGRFADVKWCPELIDRLEGKNGYDKMDDMAYIADSLHEHQDYLSRALTRFDRRPIDISIQISLLEFAMHNFGFSLWTNTSISPYIDLGIIVPSAGYLPINVDVVAQTAFAFSPVDKWSVGVGLKAVKRVSLPAFEFFPLNYEEDLDSLNQRIDDLRDVFDIENLKKISLLSYALDFGVLYQIHRELRLGASLRDFYLDKLVGESITPNLSFGLAATPRFLQNNNWFDRKINIAADYVDILNDNLFDMPLSHLNFGLEIEHVIIPSPTKNMSGLWHFIFGALGSALGGGAGYYLGDSFGGTIGSLVGLGVGALYPAPLGALGRGASPVTISVGGGFEGGYWSATGAAKVTFLELRFSSFAEEMGVKTGQSENRHYMLQVSTIF